MRFEWLFLGILLLIQIPAGNFTLFPLGGFVLMLFALFRLAKFEESFKKAKFALFFAVPLGAAIFALQIYLTAAGDEPSWYNATYLSVRFSSEIAEMTSMFFIYIGVKAIGVKTDLRALENNASRNMTIMFVYFILQVSVSALGIFNPSFFEREGFAIIQIFPFAVGLLWRLLNLWMILKCYLGITVETDELREKRLEKERKKEAGEAELRRQNRIKRKNKK